MNDERLSRIEEFVALEKEEIDEIEVKELVWYIVFMLDSRDIDDRDILRAVIRLKKCKINHAKNFLRNMKELGLDVSRIYGYYSMSNFGSMRGYIPNDYFQFVGTEDNHWSEEEKDMFNKFTAEIEGFKKKVFDTINQGHPITVKN